MKYKGIFVFSAVIIVMFCALGWFSRPYPADEFAFHNTTAEKGIIGAVIHQYNHENGRIVNHIFMDVFAGSMEKTYPFMASINSLAYILVCFSLAGALFPALAFGAKLSLSFLACALTLCFTYSLNESFYWLAGMPYFLSGTLLLLVLSLAIRAFRGSRLSFILCIASLFLSGTIHEQPCVFQGVIAFVAMIFFMVRGNRKYALMSCVLWLMSIAVFCSVYFSPGSISRMNAAVKGSMGSHSTISQLLAAFIPTFSQGILNTIKFFSKPLLYVVLFFLPAIADKVPPADEKLSRSLKAWHIVAVMFAINMFMEYMIGVITGWSLPERGISLSMWMMYVVWNILWVFFYRGKLIHSEGFRNFCAKYRWPLLILSVLVSYNFINCVKELRIAPEYAREFDARSEMLFAQGRNGVRELTAPRIKTRPELMFWEIKMATDNKQIARYYGGDTLYLVPEELSGDAEAVKKLKAGNLEPLEVLADNGDTESMRMLGVYWDPRGSNKNPDADKAAKYYKMGAENGDYRCMKSVSRLLLRRNFLEAVYWLLRHHIATTRL